MPGQRVHPLIPAYYDPATFNAEPGEMLRLEFNVMSDEDENHCLYIKPLVRHLRIIAPVCLRERL
jgi:hypothetical protein